MKRKNSFFKKLPLALLLLGSLSIQSNAPILIPERTTIQSFQLKPLDISKDRIKELRKDIKALNGKKMARDMDFKTLRKLIELTMLVGDYDDALTYSKHAFNKTKDSMEREKIKLARADIHFEQSAYKKALKEYSEFCELYPGSQNSTEYALYKQTVSQFLLLRKPDQDQTPTHATLQLADAYQSKGKAYKRYTREIKDIQRQCHMQLYRHEKGIFEFYLKKGSLKAADSRLASLKKEFIKKVPVEAETLEMECRLAIAQKDTKRHEHVLAQLTKKFPQRATKLAFLNKASKKKKHADRF